ncbi:hypothetical protein FRACA_150030 [Frankia canadensis]|uniref:Uncharacterized protein n=1 Tax=Frankia canadensis TaxID=1836972 RepID=A0A2I2KLW8_9ACTN|nr:hypothetical protein FRACA_150030 [Frankia canadensis]SOU53948.1 hypothetical protein FRACA_150030 [Frankia canadensis]
MSTKRHYSRLILFVPRWNVHLHWPLPGHSHQAYVAEPGVPARSESVGNPHGANRQG